MLNFFLLQMVQVLCIGTVHWHSARARVQCRAHSSCNITAAVALPCIRQPQFEDPLPCQIILSHLSTPENQRTTTANHAIQIKCDQHCQAENCAPIIGCVLSVQMAMQQHTLLRTQSGDCLPKKILLKSWCQGHPQLF